MDLMVIDGFMLTLGPKRIVHVFLLLSGEISCKIQPLSINISNLKRQTCEKSEHHYMHFVFLDNST